MSVEEADSSVSWKTIARNEMVGFLLGHFFRSTVRRVKVLTPLPNRKEN